MRIVSLIPSATEIVCALGAQDELVGISHECNYPPAALEGLPALSRARLPDRASSIEIDRSVRNIVAQGTSVYEVDARKLKNLRPDVILTQSYCDVCAVSENELHKALKDWTQAKPKLVNLSPSRLEDLWGSILEAGLALGREDKARALVEELKARLADIKRRIEEKAAAVAPTKIVALEWLAPLMSSGSWSPEICALLGAREMLGKGGEKARYLTLGEIADQDPDILLVTLCGFDIPRSLEDVRALEKEAPWRQLRAVRQGRVYVCNGNHFFSRPGPRLVETAEILAEILYPDLFSFGHAGKDFIAVDCAS